MRRAMFLVLAACAPATLGATLTQTYNVDYDGDLMDPGFAFPTTTFQTFDDMGGTRQLTGITLDAQIDASMTVLIQNFDTVAYESGDWSAEITASFLAVFFDNNAIDGPTVGFGGLYVVGVTGYLSAGTGGFPFGTPGEDTVTASTSGTISSHVSIDPSYAGYFSSGGTLDVSLPLLSEFLLTPPAGGGGFGIFGGPSAVAQHGTISLTYEYVPAPASAGVLALGGLVATRRRR